MLTPPHAVTRTIAYKVDWISNIKKLDIVGIIVGLKVANLINIAAKVMESVLNCKNSGIRYTPVE